MLEKQNKILYECNMKMLEQQFENEDLAKEILYYAKDKEEFEIQERRNFLNRRLEQRKNLYIYPQKVNA